LWVSGKSVGAITGHHCRNCVASLLTCSLSLPGPTLRKTGAANKASSVRGAVLGMPCPFNLLNVYATSFIRTSGCAAASCSG